MDSLPQLVTDLALILIVAGVVTIVFKRLRQPLVLGYIVAGFLAGPNMPLVPTVGDSESIEVWSQIGVIFMMFSLGLEFSFKKLLKMGIQPIITACLIMMSMIGVGCGIGYLFGWSLINCMFLGGMLSMSSTTIIYKAFADLGLSNKNFAGKVLSVLILEDILGIVVMVILSALAARNTLEGTELIWSLVKLGFFLAVWFLIGLWLIPLFLHRNSKFINSETLLIVSIGLCFLMVVIANQMGYSPALGAFVMGSILAETVEAEKIEKTIGSVKDLFGAIFFVSVGMLVSPTILAEYWLPILVLVLGVVLGQMVFGTTGYLVGGCSFKDALQSGFSMVQIGEFSFIIAVMGESLHVTDKFLYPVVVAVSIITTFLTPYSIRAAGPLYQLIGGKNENEGARRKASEKERKRRKLKPWPALLSSILFNIVVYLILVLAILGLLFVSFLLLARQMMGHWWGNAICGVVTLSLLSLFIRPIVMKKNHSIEAMRLYRENLQNKILLSLIFLARFALGCMIIYYVLDYLSPYKWYWHILVSILLLVFIVRNRMIKYWSIRMERTFIQNTRRREMVQRQTNQSLNPRYARHLRGRDLHIARLTLPSGTMWAGSTLAQLRIGVLEQVHIVAIVRDGERINIPGGRTMLFPNDVIEVLGDDESIEMFSQHMVTDVQQPLQGEQEDLQLTRIIIGPTSPLIGLFIKQSGIRDELHCMVVGFEDGDGNLTIANADRIIHRGDTMWVVGEKEDIKRLKERV